MSKPMWTVSGINRYLKSKMDTDAYLQGIIIQGEISNFNQHYSGHWYFTLKDERSRISCVMFASYASKNLLIPQNGMKVIIKGNVSIFETSGQYQIYVTKISEDGIGDLFYQFELLKKKLANEGLFADIYKKPLPKYPMKIGVISGADTAALHDIRTTIARRWPIAELFEFYCLVQGEQAKNDLVLTIEKADCANCDLLILARGGGSIEDLWPFNEEIVARAVFACKTPIITGVGHEIDTTIVDFISDKRAPTPTAAAEMATPDYHKVLEDISNYKTRLLRLQLLQMPIMQLDLYNQRLNRYMDLISQKQQSLLQYKERLVQCAKWFIQKQRYEIDTKEKRLFQYMEQKKNIAEYNYSKQIQLLEAFSPLQVLKRGYAIVSNEKQVTSVNDVSIDDMVHIRLKDGYLHSIIYKKESL